MRHLALLLPFVAGCAAWQPSLTDAGLAAREIACTVCQELLDMATAPK